MMQTKLIAFDLEVYPEWSCMVYVEHSEKLDNFDDLKVITSDDDNYRQALKAASQLGCLAAFNGKSYDMQVLDMAIIGYTPAELYDFSRSIIDSPDRKWKSIRFWNKYSFTDLFDDLKSMGSLKQFMSNIGLPIEECPVPFGKRNLTPEEKQLIIDYCKSDVRALCKLINARLGYLKSKAMVSKMSHLTEAECLKNTSAKICAKITFCKQKENPHPPVYRFPEHLEPLFREYIHPIILDKFDGALLENDFSYTCRFFKNNIVFGAGGAHSTLADSIYSISNDDEVLVIADYENLYPGLLDTCDYWPTGMPEKGREQFRHLLGSCRTLKKELRANWDTDVGELRESQKLVLNAATGAMRAPFSDLFDPQNIIALCFTGQLVTTAIAKLVFDYGGTILQTNTDGIVYKIARSKLDEVTAKLTAFSVQARVPLEIEPLYSIYQKNVNNYILFSKKGGKPELKGRWARQSGSDVPLNPLNAPIINDAVMKFYNDGTPIADTIYSCKDPLDFMFTTIKGRTYNYVIYEINGREDVVNNVNRVYASTNKNLGTLRKVKLDPDMQEVAKDKIAGIPSNCSLCNGDVSTNIFRDIDHEWYIAAAERNAVEMARV